MVITDKFHSSIKEIPIEEVLSSRGRVKIIKLLAECGELNISAISKKVQLNHSTVKNHLDFLVEVGVVREKKFGRIRIYEYQDYNIRAHSLKQLFKIWEES
ncbi:MAG: winged helix-turn-helix domain-containing protein [Candidatus Heimdallarchaeaceae archaeon]